MDDLAARIARHVASPAAEDFDELAGLAFAFQYERVAPFRRLCDARGATPGKLGSWREVPAVPTSAFRSLELTVAPPTGAPGVETFRSSGTTAGGSRSVHVHPYPDLYRATVDAAFPAYCLPKGDRPAMLVLAPSREEAPDSSLAFMLDHVVSRFGGVGSERAFGPRGVDARAARSWAGARQREGRPVLVLGTTLALADLVASLARMDLRFRLPPGSAVFETGGAKGRQRGVEPPELLAGLGERLGIAPGSVVREYGMTELTSQLYTRALLGGDADLYTPPHWVRLRVIDPETLAEAPSGASGLVAIFDLANLSSAVHVLSEDLGRMEAGGLRLLGRAPGAELRGCSLTVEELAGQGPA
jgi:hypothetical protein